MLIRVNIIRQLTCIAFGFLWLTALVNGTPSTAHADTPLAPLQWTDTAGVAYGPADLAKSRATVFFWVSTQCPLASRYTPRVLALAARYKTDDISCFLVDSNPLDSREALTTFATERAYPFPAVSDASAVLADRLGATTTPEAVVVDGSGKIVYLGRIDDNADSERVICRDLKSALDALIADRPIRHARTRAFGCAITRLDASNGPTGGAKSAARASLKSPLTAMLTYAHDIAPILAANCVTCHHAGDAAPFALDTYEQAKLWSASMKDYTTRRQMPPWKALPEFGGPYHDSRYLTDADIANIGTWCDAGAPRGGQITPAKTDAASTMTALAADVAWPMGTPDLVVAPSRSFHLPAEGRDVYRDFALPANFDEDRYVSAFDFLPGCRAAIHHVVVYVDASAESDDLEGTSSSPEPGWSVTGGGSGLARGVWGDVWTPGMTPRRLPEGVAIRIPRGARLVLQVHYHKTGKPEVDRTALALYYLKTPLRRVLHTLPVANAAFNLTAGVADQSVVAEDILPCDVTLLQIFPHMHMLGTEMKVTATLPDGTEKPLVYVKHWDFNWQMTYRYQEPIRLPRGTRIRLVALFDNTAKNPNQSSNPPQRVRVGDQLTDEMCSVFLGMTQDDETVPAAGAETVIADSVGNVP